MEKPQDDSNVDKYTNEKVEKGIQDLLEEKELKITWRKEIEQNETIQDYFKSYNERSVVSFVDSYINNKYLWYKYGDMYKRMSDENQSQWIVMAHEHLEAILQKKLFDLQCLWRAEQLEIEGVKICFDFNIWENDIFNCPFLEPINKNDIELYQEYLLKNDTEFGRFSISEEWQNYEDIKNSYISDNGESEMPAWYEFHNLRTGNSKLLLLPDIRGEKEQFYSELYFKNKEQKIEIKEKQIVIEDLDKRLYLENHKKDVVSFFVKTFETKEIQNKFHYYQEANESDNDNEYYEEIFRDLLENKEYIPISSHYDFKEALKLAYNNFCNKKLSDHLPIALEQYLFNIKMGFSVERDNDFYIELRNTYTQRFMEGRVLNGEEHNLNF
jgi:hypothetical protein